MSGCGCLAQQLASLRNDPAKGYLELFRVNVGEHFGKYNFIDRLYCQF